MEEGTKKRYRFGLLGRNISYSFSKGYFAKKFSDLGLENHSYENFDIQDISEFKTLLDSKPLITGMNVTIPYKEAVIPYLTTIDPQAKEVGAVNTIRFTPKGSIGYNTDTYGFQSALQPNLKNHHTHALILGTGGASKAIAYILSQLGIHFNFVSRQAGKGQLTYSDLNAEIMQKHLLLINCTPLGTHPDINAKPDLPYRHISDRHLLFDLIYNPEITAFMKAGLQQGATICNGYKMLEFQAEKSWEIWNR